MKKITILLLATFALVANEAISQIADQDKKPAIVFVENGNQDVFSGKIYSSSVRGASRNGNGNSNGAFANQGDWSVDLVVSEKSPQQVAEQHGNIDGGFVEANHPLYNLGDGSLSLISEGLGAVGWGSFAANAYNRASGLGSVSIGFSNLAGPQEGASGGPGDGGIMLVNLQLDGLLELLEMYLQQQAIEILLQEQLLYQWGTITMQLEMLL